jgi:hypothetical protein
MGNQIRRSVVLIVSAACGLMTIPTGNAQLPAAPSACSLLEREAAEQAFGASLGEARLGVNNGTVTTCSFPVKGGGRISILFRRHAGRAWIKEHEQRMNMGVRYGSFHPAAGLGGHAFVLDMRQSGAALCVFRADYYLQVSVFNAGAAAEVFPGVEKLARVALARLEPLPVDTTALAQRTR